MKITLLAGIFACCSFAQAPNVIRVVREGLFQPSIYDRAAVNAIGLSAVSGPAETWRIELHDSFASLEDLDKTLSAAGFLAFPGTSGPVSGDGVLPASNTVVARHRPGLSYRPEQAIQNLAKARYLDVVIYRIAPGDRADFAKVQRLREFGLDSINSDRPDMAYEVVSGAPSGTYISLTPLLSLRSLDEERPATPFYAEGAVAAARKLSGSMDTLRERLWFRMEPQLSSVSREFAAPDAGFWHPTTIPVPEPRR